MARKIKVIAIIVAAGRGERFGGEIPKQYSLLAGKPVLRHTVEAFLAHPGIDAVQVVIHQDHKDLYTKVTAGLKLLPPVVGGTTRQASVRAGLDALDAHAPELVLVHDAARPFASAQLIDRVLHALEHAPAVIPSIPLADTVKRVERHTVLETVERVGLESVQTPQGFHFAECLKLHRAAAGKAATDDAGLYEAAGLKVATVQGEAGNFKITLDEDIKRAEQMMQHETRTGTGFDVHPFEAGDGVMLCGVKVKHTHKLKGHSDADAGLHALVDALLGAIGAGDIGQHFPPSDPKWKNADSGKFVEHAVKLIEEKGGRVINADITIICESPKIGPHREAMQQRTAELLGIASDRVNIKATTTEQLGFTGRKEGIAAQAVANVSVPYVR